MSSMEVTIVSTGVYATESLDGRGADGFIVVIEWQKCVFRGLRARFCYIRGNKRNQAH